MADKVKDTIDINASAEDVFAVATDFDAYPEWNPDIKNIEVRKRDDQGLALHVWMEVDAKLKVVRYTLAYDYANAPESFSWSLLEGDIKNLNGTYSFDDFGDVTEVGYELEIDPGFPVPGMLKRQAERRIVKSALQGLKERVESLQA